MVLAAFREVFPAIGIGPGTTGPAIGIVHTAIIASDVGQMWDGTPGGNQAQYEPRRARRGRIRGFAGFGSIPYPPNGPNRSLFVRRDFQTRALLTPSPAGPADDE